MITAQPSPRLLSSFKTFHALLASPRSPTIAPDSWARTRLFRRGPLTMWMPLLESAPAYENEVEDATSVAVEEKAVDGDGFESLGVVRGED